MGSVTWIRLHFFVYILWDLFIELRSDRMTAGLVRHSQVGLYRKPQIHVYSHPPKGSIQIKLSALLRAKNNGCRHHLLFSYLWLFYIFFCKTRRTKSPYFQYIKDIKRQWENQDSQKALSNYLGVRVIKRNFYGLFLLFTRLLIIFVNSNQET